MRMHLPPRIIDTDFIQIKRPRASWLTLAKTVAVVTALVGSGALGYWGGRAIAPIAGQWEIAIVDHHPAPPPRPTLPTNPFTMP